MGAAWTANLGPQIGFLGFTSVKAWPEHFSSTYWKQKGRGNCTDLLSLVIICRQYIRGQHESGGAATPLNRYELLMTDFVPRFCERYPRPVTSIAIA